MGIVGTEQEQERDSAIELSDHLAGLGLDMSKTMVGYGKGTLYVYVRSQAIANRVSRKWKDFGVIVQVIGEVWPA